MESIRSRKWRNILLVSSTNVVDSLTLGGSTLAEAQASYAGALATLQEAVNDYGKGAKATGVRSIKGEDIDRIAEYDVTTFTGLDYIKLLIEDGGGNIEDIPAEQLAALQEQFRVIDYGRTITFSWDGTTKPVYSFMDGSNTVTGSLDYTHNMFTWYDETAKVWRTSTNPSAKKDIVDDTVSTAKASVTNNMVYYLGTKLGETTAAYEMLIANDDDNPAYWLASPCVMVGPDYAAAYFGLRSVHDGLVAGYDFVHSTGSTYVNSNGVRAVVSLESDIQLSPNGANAWKIAN